MLPFGVTIPATVPQRSEIPEGLMNYPIYIYSFSSLSVDRSKTLPKPALHIVRSRASSFKWEYPLLSLRSSNSFLRLLPRLPVIYIPPFIFPSIAHCRRQFLRKMWPIQLPSRLLISCRIFPCSLTLNNTASFLTWLALRKKTDFHIRCFPYPIFTTNSWHYVYCNKNTGISLETFWGSPLTF